MRLLLKHPLFWYFGLIAAATYVWLGPSIVRWVKAQKAQIVQVQQFRTDFAVNCVRQKGYTIQLSRTDTSIICVGPDGRIIGRY